MMRKWVVGAVAILAAISLGGIGFSVFTSSVAVQVNGQAGSIQVIWTGPGLPAVTTSNPYVSCTVSLSASVILLTLQNVAPGDSCTLPASDGVQLSNIGTIPATLSQQAHFFPGPCYWFFTENYGPAIVPNSPTPPAEFATLAGGASAPAGGYTFTTGLEPGQGNSCEHASVEYVLYTNATAGV
jgi:hypothetical protein